jgi:glycosyltransferase involved in cell wall biosynthesis
LRIAFYCNLMGWPKRSGGGVRQWVLTMANALVARGYEVDVLSEAPKSKFVDEPQLDPRVGRVLLGYRIFSRLKLDAYVRANPGVRVVAALNEFNIRAAKLKQRVGARAYVMITQRENLSADAEWRSPRKYEAAANEIRRNFGSADAVVSVSHGLTDDLRENFGIDPARLHTIYNPTYREAYVRAASEPVDHPWLTDKDQPVVIAAGRLHFVKGFYDLLDAFAIVRAARPARLLILGEGKERPQLQAHLEKLGLQDCVQMPGRKPTTAPWFARSDLFVLSSKREGLPAVLIEAMSVGTPVVATDCPSGPHEILDGGRLAPLVPVGDPAALAAAIGRVLDGPRPDTAPLQARAAEFSLERALAQYLALLEQPPGP